MSKKRRISGQKIYDDYRELLPVWQQDPSKSTGLFSREYLIGYRECIEDLIADIEDGVYDE